MERLLEKIIAFANGQEDIRTLILSGSTARNDSSKDDFSDLDVSIYTTHTDKYEQSAEWIKTINEVWVYLPLKTDEGFATRLVIFSKGRKVDFTLFPLSKLVEETKDEKLSDLYNRGYEILVDKDKLASKLPQPQYIPPLYQFPSEKEYIALVEEFWFEIYHIAKYLKREDLWAVKFRDWGVKELLLQMIVLSERSIHGKDYDTWYLGIKIKKWVEPEILEKINAVFAHFDSQDSWKALFRTMNLFRDIARSTADRLSFKYPIELDTKMTEFVKEQYLKI